MAKMLTFTAAFDKKLEANLSVHYAPGGTYPVPDELLEEVATITTTLPETGPIGYERQGISAERPDGQQS